MAYLKDWSYVECSKEVGRFAAVLGERMFLLQCLASSCRCSILTEEGA